LQEDILKSSLAALALLLVFGQSSLALQGPSDTLTIARKVYIASRFYFAAQKYFAHWGDVPNLDFETSYKQYLDDALAAHDRRAFTLASSAFLVRLGNSHTMFLDKVLQDDAGGQQPFLARYLRGQWIVLRSDQKGLEPGDIITEIDGKPFEDFYQGVSRYISASTERFRRRNLFSAWWSYLFPKQYTLTLAGGKRVFVDRSGKATAVPQPETTGRLVDKGRIGYIQVPSWLDKKFQSRALELLNEYKASEGIIIDVRGNAGGSTPSSFVRALMDRPWKWWAESTPMSFSLFSYYAESGRDGFSSFAHPSMSWPAGVNKGDSTYTGPLAILIDEGTHSASEDFTMPFKESHRAILIGDTTGGSTGQPYVEQLGDGFSFVVGAKREWFPDGSRFEGIGIQPDILVLPTPDHLKSGKDDELQKAIDVIEDQIAGRR
jgi:carboxyl-terminal processing protease